MRSIYSRPSKPRTMTVKDRRGAPEVARLTLPEPIMIDTSTECHVTPPDTAALMADYLEVDYQRLHGVKVLEPEAGTGNLIRALFDIGFTAEQITAIEQHYNLCNSLSSRFKGDETINPLQSCFLEYVEAHKGTVSFDYILMNPPFKTVKKHIEAALSVLGGDGVMVALVPVSFSHPDAEELESLPDTTFALAKVNTKLVRFYG